MKRNSLKTITAQIITSLLAAWMLYGAGGEFYQIAWGTGTWRGEFSFKWGMAYYLFGDGRPAAAPEPDVRAFSACIFPYARPTAIIL